MQRDIGSDPWQRLHQEVGCSHPGLDRAEGMLDRLTPLAHLLRMLVEPALHRLENVLMLPSGDPAFLASGAALLDGAALTGIGPIAAHDQSVFLGRIVVGEPFAGLLMRPQRKALSKSAKAKLGLLRKHYTLVNLYRQGF